MTTIELTPALQQAADAYVASQTSAGTAWPEAAEYALVLRIKHHCIWWDRSHSEARWGDVRIRFFADRAALDAFVQELNALTTEPHWDVAYQSHAWDWGPQPLEGWFTQRNLAQLTGRARPWIEGERLPQR